MIKTCILVFLARIVDVSIGTIRTAYFIKGKNKIYVILSFFEVFIWFLVARKALNTEINSLIIPIFYSLGYATGTYIGIKISSKLLKNDDE